MVGHFSHVTYFPLKSHYLSQAGTSPWLHRGRPARHAGELPAFVGVGTCGRAPGANRYGRFANNRMWYVERGGAVQSAAMAGLLWAWLNRHGLSPWKGFVRRQALSLRFRGDAGLVHARRANRRRRRLLDTRYIDGDGAAIGQTPDIQLGDARTTIVEREVETGAFAIRNGGDSSRTLQCRFYECADAIEPLSFNRGEPETDVWRPVIHGNPDFFDNLDPIKMSAALVRGRHESASLFADVQLDKGAYRVGAYLWKEVGAANTSRATLEFRIGSHSMEGPDGIVIGDITPWAQQGDSGWAWYELAQIESDGSVQRLRVSASVPSERDKAFADMGRVVFVPAAWRDEGGPFGPKFSNQRFTLAAGEQTTFGVPMLPDRTGRFDMFVEDSASHDVRFVNWYVMRRVR